MRDGGAGDSEGFELDRVPPLLIIEYERLIAIGTQPKRAFRDLDVARPRPCFVVGEEEILRRGRHSGSGIAEGLPRVR